MNNPTTPATAKASYTFLKRSWPEFFTQLTFVLKAKTTDPTRYFMDCLHVEDGPGEGEMTMVCTDAKRLHKATILPGFLPPGDYHLVKATTTMVVVEEYPDTDGHQFPTWQKVMPDRKGAPPVVVDLSGRDISDRSLGVCKLIRLLPPDCAAVNLVGFMEDLKGFTWTTRLPTTGEQDTNKHAILLESSATGCVAVVMPMKTEN